MERSEGIVDATMGGHTKAIFQFRLEGKLRCALTRKFVTEKQWECAERSGPSRVYCEGSICVRRFDHYFNQDIDMQGNWKQA